MKHLNNPRAAAASILFDVLEQGISLSQSTAHSFQEKPLVLELCYGTLRHYHELDYLLKQLMPKPIRNKERIIYYVLLIGLYQLRYLRTAPHAAVSETVNVVNLLKKTWAKALVNGVLREYLRSGATIVLPTTPDMVFEHPAWFMQTVQAAWPDDWQKILMANQQHAPMTLRVNCRHLQRDDYLALLHKENIEATAHPFVESAIQLTHSCDVTLLPGFAAGWVSVQDAAAQLCSFLLPITENARVLDACAAPGGKSCHLLERHPSIQLTALDIHEKRHEKTLQNLTRLKLQAQLLTADAANVSTWWDGQAFDAILLDAPCSATGVIRRHPDIKFLRHPDDFESLPKTQLHLLQQLWPTLKPKGFLLYATCSIIPAENDAVIKAFLAQCQDAQLIPLEMSIGRKTTQGWQLLPGDADMDGFYYCLLQRA